MGTNFWEIFNNQIFPALNTWKGYERGHTMKFALETLQGMKEDGFLIVETGTARKTNNWGGDGQSTLIFDLFVSSFGGNVISVDLNEQHCITARNNTSNRTQVVANDSVSFLYNFKPDREIDLLYLDSYDLDHSNPHPSSMHHIKELCAIISKLSTGTLIMVDDARCKNTKFPYGKAQYIKEFMDNIGIEPIFHRYQAGWIFKQN